MQQKQEPQTWESEIMTFHKAYVLGAGAIGSVFGAFLSREYDVTLVGNKAHAEAVNRTGLMLCGRTEEKFHLKADTRIHDIPSQTLVILTTKAFDSARAIRGINEIVKNDTVILILQNGLGNEEVVRKEASKELKIIRAITTMAAEVLEPGRVRFWDGETIVDWTGEGKKVLDMFSRCNLKTRATKTMNQEIWRKLVLNCIVNPLSAILGVKNNELVADSLRTIRRQIASECLRVAEAEGVSLETHVELEIDRRISRYTNFSSMYKDLQKRGKTEIDFLNGRVVQLGRKHCIRTPANEMLTSFIRFKEETNELRREY